MPESNVQRTLSASARCRRAALLVLYPDLKALPESEWQPALSRARGVPLDTIERIGVIAGVALAAWLLRESVPAAGMAAALAGNVLRFFAAIALLAVTVGPLLLRRTRRGLAALRHQRKSVSPMLQATPGGKS